MTETLLDKAFQNLAVATNTYNTMCHDEVYLKYVGYHLQQAVELSLKYLLEENGIEYIKTHDITQLLFSIKDAKLNVEIPEYIKEHADMFTIWESKTRYITNYRLEKEKVGRAINEVTYFVELLLGEPIDPKVKKPR